MAWLLFLVFCLLEQPGRTTWDTKFDLTADPGAFLARTLHLWNPEASFGELQNQAYGYLFPQGPFFLLGELAGVPDWIVQRLWSAVLLIIAYEGTRLVARALGLASAGAVVAGLVYALSPRLLSSVGILTSEALPSALLPWVVLPLVLARNGRLGPRQSALWSGVAVLCMSGVNAAATLAVLPLAAFVVLEQIRRPHGRALALWWSGAVTAACAWWLGPLLLLGKYSPPFLDFIEDAEATTSATGWANNLRGAEHWLAYLTIGDQPWQPGAHEMATEPVLIAVSGLVAALGLVGLCRREMPLRRPLLAAAVVGLLCLTAGHPATLGSFVDGPVRHLLDGPLAALRNVHKVDPLVRLPLALGAGHGIVILLRSMEPRRDLRRGVMVAVVALVVASGAPLITGDLRMPGFREVPPAWQQAADYLAQQPRGRALVVPGSSFGLQTWGWTVDEPLQGVASSPWVSRNLVPMMPGPTARYLDTIERRVTSGEGGEGLSGLLARGGISHVVLRRDLDSSAAETVPFDRAELALVTSPGLRRVAGFGRSGVGGQAMIELYRVDGATDTVSLADADGLGRLQGAPEDLLSAIDTDLLDPDRPVVITADAEEGGRIVGDGYRRVERQFGRVYDGVGQVMSRADPWRLDRPTHDFPGVAGVPLATAEYVAGMEVTASSSQGNVDALGPVVPAYGPHAAVDGRPYTEWRSATLRPPGEQWLQVELDDPLVGGGRLRVQFEDRADTAHVERVELRVRSEAGTWSAVHDVPESGLLSAATPGEGGDRIRVEVVEVSSDTERGRVVVSELTLPGVEPGRTTVVPADLAADDSLVLRVDPARPGCVELGLGAPCTEREAHPSEDAGVLDRTIDVAEAGEWDVSGRVVAVPNGIPEGEGPAGAVCGTGPEVRVDGKGHATEVVGTLDDVRLGRPLTWSVCGGPVALSVGVHRIQVEPTLPFQPETLGWRPSAGADQVDPTSGRSMTIGRWDATSRRVVVGPGDEAVLRVAENVNDGWEATLAGDRLDEVTLDGWQQGYRVPAGEGGEIALVYRPDRTYRAALLGGFVLAGLLVMSAPAGQLVERRRRRDQPPPDPDPVEERSVGPIGRGATAVGLMVLGGPVAAVGYAVAALTRWRDWTWAVGGFLVVASAVAAAFAAGTEFGSPGLGANLMAAAGAGLLVGWAQFDRPRRRRAVPPLSGEPAEDHQSP